MMIEMYVSMCIVERELVYAFPALCCCPKLLDVLYMMNLY